ncbi:DNA-binding CsgD family transcriptional regulator [Sphingomonas sp. UYAg733]
MTEDRLDQLSARQIECLRLVGQGKRTKDIARFLGRSHHTIHREIENATRLLGAATRFDAAELVRTHRSRLQPGSGPSPDPDPGPDPDPDPDNDEAFVNEPQDLAAPWDYAAHRSLQPPLHGDGDEFGIHAVREEIAPFIHRNPSVPPDPRGASEGASLHDLIKRYRVIVAIVAAFLLAALLAGFLAIAHELQQLLIAWAYPPQ